MQIGVQANTAEVVGARKIVAQLTNAVQASHGIAQQKVHAQQQEVYGANMHHPLTTLIQRRQAIATKRLTHALIIHVNQLNYGTATAQLAVQAQEESGALEAITITGARDKLVQRVHQHKDGPATTRQAVKTKVETGA